MYIYPLRPQLRRERPAPPESCARGAAAGGAGGEPSRRRRTECFVRPFRGWKCTGGETVHPKRHTLKWEKRQTIMLTQGKGKQER